MSEIVRRSDKSSEEQILAAKLSILTDIICLFEMVLLA